MLIVSVTASLGARCPGNEMLRTVFAAGHKKTVQIVLKTQKYISRDLDFPLHFSGPACSC